MIHLASAAKLAEADFFVNTFCDVNYPITFVTSQIRKVTCPQCRSYLDFS